MTKKEKEPKQKLKTVNIKGNEYVTVNVRLLEAHKLYGDRMSIISDIVHCDDNSVRVKSVVRIETDKINANTGEPIYRVYTGHAEELRAEGYINKTSALENCETSAIGRALGILGIGIEEGIASKEEIDIAESKKSYLPKSKAETDFINELENDFEEVCDDCGKQISKAEYDWCMDRAKNYDGKKFCKDCQANHYKKI